MPEEVKHIPQSHLEKICAEIQDSSAPTLFDAEVEGVIFSHVLKSDRLGYESLPDLVAHTASEKEERIRQLQGRLGRINREYLALRQRSSEQSKKTLTGQLAARKAELVAHEKAKPETVPEPKEAAKANPEVAGVQDELRKVVAQIEELDGKLKEQQKREAEAKKRMVAVERLQGRIENLKATVESFYEQSTADAALLGLDATAARLPASGWL